MPWRSGLEIGKSGFRAGVQGWDSDLMGLGLREWWEVEQTSRILWLLVHYVWVHCAI